MLIAGLDEAGRGPVLGSLMIGCVLIDDKDLPKLEEIGANDSKQLRPKQRNTIAELIKSTAMVWRVREITAAQINQLHADGLSLNEIEEQNFAQLLNEITPHPE